MIHAPRPDDELLDDELLDDELLDDEPLEDELDDEAPDDELLDDELDEERLDVEPLDDVPLDDELSDDVLLVDALPWVDDEEAPVVVSCADEVLADAPPVEELPLPCESVVPPVPVAFPPAPVESLPEVCSGALTSLAQPAAAQEIESPRPPNTKSRHLRRAIHSLDRKRW